MNHYCFSGITHNQEDCSCSCDSCTANTKTIKQNAFNKILSQKIREQDDREKDIYERFCMRLLRDSEFVKFLIIEIKK